MEEKELQRAVLVGIAKRTSDQRECMISLDELERLLDTAGGVCVAKMLQVKSSYEPATCIGSGKVKELSELCVNNGATLVVFDIDLSPSQIRNLENAMENGARVIDRSMLILDIFALHAESGEGKLQVELAQLKYTAPRLIGKGAELSRQGGKIGTRGPGESQLESDRRHMKRRIDALEAQLAEMEHNRLTMRASRDRSGIPKVAIVGYTNSGKSTLLNYLTDAGVLSENKLFATLDPTTRRLEIDNKESVLLTDTVGFIRRLPHHLVKAFKSTLDEVVYADIILIVADITDSECQEHLKVTHDILESLGASDKPKIIAYNKCDMLAEAVEFPENCVGISALTGSGVQELMELIKEVMHNTKKRCELHFPYSAQSELNALFKTARVESTEYTDAGTDVIAVLDKKDQGIYKKFIKN